MERTGGGNPFCDPAHAPLGVREILRYQVVRILRSL